MKQQTKHIVLLTPGFPKDEADSTCIPALQIYARELAKNKNYKLTILTVHYPPTTLTYSWHNCKVHSLGIGNKKGKRLQGFYRHWKVLAQIHKQTPIDALHSFWLGECAFIGHHFSEKQSIKHFVTLMGQDAKKGNRYATLLPIKKMNLITLSSFQSHLMNENYSVKSEIIPWGVASPNYNLDQKSIDIIGIGSLIELKRFSEFIETIQLLSVNYPNLKAVIVGDGVLREKLANQISTAGLAETILIKGELSYPETQALLAQSKVLLHPSYYESYGMIFAEALSFNIPIISRKVGFAEVGTHWEIGESPLEFAKSCAKLLENNEMPTISYPKIETTVMSYQNLYEQ